MALPSTSDMRKAPTIPRTQPQAAPISRFRLTRSRRISKRMMHSPKTTPPAAAIQGEELYGCKSIGRNGENQDKNTANQN